jgi:fatty acid desaturase
MNARNVLPGSQRANYPGTRSASDGDRGRNCKYEVEGEPSSSGVGVQQLVEAPRRLAEEEDPPFSSRGEFGELCRLVKQSHLLQKKPAPLLWLRAAILLAVMALILAIMVLGHDRVVWQLFNGVLLAFLFMHISFVMHDAGHRQIFRSAAANRALGLILGNLFVGVSYTWWVDKHNRHHRNPNHVDLDPDVDFVGLAFSKEQAMAKKRPWKLIVKYQAFLFIPFLLAEHLHLHATSAAHVLRGRTKIPWSEGILLVCHHIACFAIAFSILDTLPAVAFLVCGKALGGLYAGLVFAPNHKGMLMVDSGSDVSLFRRQVLTSRNVRSGPVNDFLYGGLNYQIEHHLFPFLRQDQLPAAQAIVKPFCRERGIRYHETGIVQSLKEILHHLHEVGASGWADDSQSFSNLGAET